MNASTVNRLLSKAGATMAEPTTRAAQDKLLERIAAGKVARKATGAHPYRACFASKSHTHHGVRPDGYGRDVPCAEWITLQQSCQHPSTDFYPADYLGPAEHRCTVCGRVVDAAA